MRIFIILFCLLSLFTASAQNLDAQRGESQHLGTLWGEKIQRTLPAVNPTPQVMQALGGSLDVSRGISLQGVAIIYCDVIDFLPIAQDGVALNVRFGLEIAAMQQVELCQGAYHMVVDPAGINIVAYDEAGAFYALQTLRQLVVHGNDGKMSVACVEIKDSPELPYRGVVEGFYGTPWSHHIRLSLIDFYGLYKMNYYIYGPKDDPYHSSPHWREPYPVDEAEQIAELVEACRRNYVTFVWAIHPGQDIKWNEEDYNNLLQKFEAMYRLGVRAFAIHFDDISGEGANPLYQTALLNRLHEEFVEAKGDVASLIVCPTDYTRLWANPRPNGSLVHYGNTLHPSVDVFWTGDAVCSDLTQETADWVASRIQRPPLFWWNFPVTDYVRNILLQGPVYGLSNEMDSSKIRGLVSNPMEHGEASKLALYSVADYTWNPDCYNPIDSWERGLSVVAPNAVEAYRTFAIHSCDTETGYRRVESWETEVFTIDTYTPQLAESLKAELRRIEAVPVQMEQCSNKALLAEVQPWLVELGKLSQRCRKAIECHELYLSGQYSRFWNAYVDNLMAPHEVAAFNAHRCGTMKLQPFYEQLMEDMAAGCYEQLSGKRTSTLKPFGVYPSLRSPQGKLMFDNDTTTYFHSGNGQRTDHFVGVDMGLVQPIHEVVILQGRNAVDDVDYFDHALLESSVDGEDWTALCDTLVGVYDIRWQGSPREARYVRLRKLPSPKTNWLAIRTFDINPVDKSLYHIDGNPFTSLPVAEKLRIDVPDNASQCTILFGKMPSAGRVVYHLEKRDGTQSAEFASFKSFLGIDVKQATAIVIDSACEIIEVVFK